MKNQRSDASRQSHPGRASRIRRRDSYSLLIAAAIALIPPLLSSCGGSSELKSNTENSAKDKTLKEQIAELEGRRDTVEVAVIKLEPKPFRTILSITGELVPVESMIVRPLMEGKLLFVRQLKVGDRVEQNELLAKIDDRDIEDEIAQQEKQIEITLKDSQLSIEELEQKKRELEFDKKLLTEGFLNKTELEKSELALKKAENALERSKIQLDQEKQKLQKELRKREKIEIKAPIAGIVVPASHLKNQSETNTLMEDDIMAENEKQVTAGTELFGLISQQGFLARCLANGKDKSQVREGQAVETTVFSFKPIKIKGRVQKVSLLQDVKSHAYTVWIELELNDPSFTSGLFVRSEIELEQKDRTLVVDKKFVKEKDGKPLLQVLENNMIKNRYVELGMKQGDDVEITSGVLTGALVSAVPEMFAEEQIVKPIELKPVEEPQQ